MDEMLICLPPNVGANLDGFVINAMAFADDFELFSQTPTGLQELLQTSIGFLATTGLKANPKKCYAVAIATVSKRKRKVIDSKGKYKIGDAVIPALKITVELKHLRTNFTADGRVISGTRKKLTKDLELLTKAALKPKQRLWSWSVWW